MVPSIGHYMTKCWTSIYKNEVLVVGNNGRSKMVNLRGIRGFLMPVNTPHTNNVITHTITQGEDDVHLLNDPIALFSATMS